MCSIAEHNRTIGVRLCSIAERSIRHPGKIVIGSLDNGDPFNKHVQRSPKSEKCMHIGILDEVKKRNQFFFHLQMKDIGGFPVPWECFSHTLKVGLNLNAIFPPLTYILYYLSPRGLFEDNIWV